MDETPWTSAQYLAAIVESSDDTILSKDLNGIIRTCNPRADQTR
jgi:PAS domain-containing protein